MSQVRGRCTSSLDSWHHGPGAPLPSLASHPGAVTLVNMRFCPYAHRTVLCLNAKGVEYDIVNCQLMTKVINKTISETKRMCCCRSPSGCGR